METTGYSIVKRSKNHLWDTCSESRNHLEVKANGNVRNEIWFLRRRDQCNKLEIRLKH